MADHFIMVIAIVAIAVTGGILRQYLKSRERQPVDGGETKALREEVAALRDRVKVLERIAIEKEDTLTRQIEELRD